MRLNCILFSFVQTIMPITWKRAHKFLLDESQVSAINYIVKKMFLGVVRVEYSLLHLVLARSIDAY